MAGAEFWGHKEPIGNLKGTCWEQRKNEKKILLPLPPPPPPKKEMHKEHFSRTNFHDEKESKK